MLCCNKCCRCSQIVHYINISSSSPSNHVLILSILLRYEIIVKLINLLLLNYFKHLLLFLYFLNILHLIYLIHLYHTFSYHNLKNKNPVLLCCYFHFILTFINLISLCFFIKFNLYFHLTNTKKINFPFIIVNT